MNNKDIKNIQPVIIGADLNCYNLSRAFHEEYGVKAQAFGRYPIGVTMNTKIIDFTTVEKMDEPETMVKTLNEYAAAHRDKKLILIGCTDDYVGMIINNRDALDPAYITPYTTAAQFEELSFKESFYNYCEKYGIPYPKTVIFKPSDNGNFNWDSLPFEFPIIIKASSSALYWKYPFDGMKKVYRAMTKEDAEKICADIYASGYPDNLIIQDTIPGDDSRMYVLTAYSDKNAKVRMMCLGHVLLEEHTPKGLGNHAAIITEYMPELMEKYKTFLEEIGYVGYSNFDIKYDSRDGSCRAFEINLRQGRSNYYVTASGNNIARNVVRDYVFGDFEDGDDCCMNEKEIYWRYIPDSIVKKYVSDEILKKITELKARGEAYSSMRYKYDLKRNLKRRAYVMLHEYRHKKKYKTYYPPEMAKKLNEI